MATRELDVAGENQMLIGSHAFMSMSLSQALVLGASQQASEFFHSPALL
jgi:hypothetical protein